MFRKAIDEERTTIIGTRKKRNPTNDMYKAASNINVLTLPNIGHNLETVIQLSEVNLQYNRGNRKHNRSITIN